MAKKRKIKISLTECKVQERIKVQRCFKYWEYNHTALECKRPDRTNGCYRCRQNDHNKNDCKAEQPQCALCKKMEYFAGIGICTKFKDALKKAKTHAVKRRRCCKDYRNATKENRGTYVEELRILQTNANRCPAAMDLLVADKANNKYEVMLISEPSRNRARNKRALMDMSKDVAIWKKQNLHIEA